MNVTKAFCHADAAKPGFFEGWYFKHRAGENVLAAIPGVAIAKTGKKTAFIQCIHNRGSLICHFPFEEFYAAPDRLYIRIGDNVFSQQGMRLDVSDGRERIAANLCYGMLGAPKHTRYAPSMMGPFSYVSFLECYHDVVSAGHDVCGDMHLCGVQVKIEGGKGYIEKDWGRSFPRSWAWMECSDFESDVRVMAAVADVPFLGARFTGILGILNLFGQEIRIATYYGARVADMSENSEIFHLAIRQGSYRIDFELAKQGAAKLAAPVLGDMSRMIEEYPSCRMMLTVAEHGKQVFRGKGRNAGFEQAVLQK